MIKMLTGVSGKGFSLKPYEQTDRFTPAEEKRYIDSGQAERVEKKKKSK